MITLALTTFNRYEMLLESFVEVIHDPRISEVVISDDASEVKYWRQISDLPKYHSKIKVSRNLSNQGVYVNKRNAVMMAENEWVLLLDSDNTINTRFIDKLVEAYPWKENYSYLPDFAKPHFDYTSFAGLQIDKSNVSGLVSRPRFDCLINTMNGFYNKEFYLKCFDPHTEPIGADSAYLNYLLLKEGGILQVVEGLQYEHRIHAGSHFQQHAVQTGPILLEVMKKIKKLY